MKTKEIDIFELLGIPGMPTKDKPWECGKALDELHNIAGTHMQYMETYKKIRQDCVEKIAELEVKKTKADTLINMTSVLCDLLQDKNEVTPIAVQKAEKEQTHEIVPVEKSTDMGRLYSRRGHSIITAFCTGLTLADNLEEKFVGNAYLAKTLGKASNYVVTWINELVDLKIEAPLRRAYDPGYRPGFKLTPTGIAMAREIMANTTGERELTTVEKVKAVEPVLTVAVPRKRKIKDSRTHKILKAFKTANPEDPAKSRLFNDQILNFIGGSVYNSYFHAWFSQTQKGKSEDKALLKRDINSPRFLYRAAEEKPYMLTEAGLNLLNLLEPEKKEIVEIKEEPECCHSHKLFYHCDWDLPCTSSAPAGYEYVSSFSDKTKKIILMFKVANPDNPLAARLYVQDIFTAAHNDLNGTYRYVHPWLATKGKGLLVSEKSHRGSAKIYKLTEAGMTLLHTMVKLNVKPSDYISEKGLVYLETLRKNK